MPPSPGSWGDGRADYFLILKSQGENRLAIRLRWVSDWSRPFRLYPGEFHVKIAPAQNL